MTYDIITQEDLQKFRLQLLEDLTRIMSGAAQPQLNKEWLRSSEVRKMLGISMAHYRICVSRTFCRIARSAV